MIELYLPPVIEYNNWIYWMNEHPFSPAHSHSELCLWCLVCSQHVLLLWQGVNSTHHIYCRFSMIPTEVIFLTPSITIFRYFLTSKKCFTFNLWYLFLCLFVLFRFNFENNPRWLIHAGKDTALTYYIRIPMSKCRRSIISQRAPWAFSANKNRLFTH